MVVEIAPNVYWVGVVDWALRHFHGYELSTHRGSTYNAYLIVDERIALVDTVWGPFRQELLENIRQVADPSKISLVVANHSEVDHSGGLPAIMQHCPNAQVVVSRRGRESVEGHYHQPWRFEAVKTGDRMPLGSCDLVFVEAPMLHWPDSMFTYVSGKGILMSNDAFGQHYATAQRFNDEVNQEELYAEALKYYANILTPFGDRVLQKIDELLGLGLPVSMIAPSHGVIWRQNLLQIVEKYQEWAAQIPEKRAVILYDTMWEATRRMAQAVGDGLTAAGIPFKVFHMAVSDRNDVLTEVFRSKAILVGSPTLNRGLLPTITPILEDLRGLSFKRKIGAAFGSYGWSGEAVREIERHFARAKISVCAEAVLAKWQPRPEDLARCRDLGYKVGRAILADEELTA